MLRLQPPAMGLFTYVESKVVPDSYDVLALNELPGTSTTAVWESKQHVLRSLPHCFCSGNEVARLSSETPPPGRVAVTGCFRCFRAPLGGLDRRPSVTDLLMPARTLRTLFFPGAVVFVVGNHQTGTW